MSGSTELTELNNHNGTNTSKCYSISPSASSDNGSSVGCDDDDNDMEESMPIYTANHQMNITCNKLENLMLVNSEASAAAAADVTNGKKHTPPPRYAEAVNFCPQRKKIQLTTTSSGSHHHHHHHHHHSSAAGHHDNHNRMSFFSTCSSCDQNQAKKNSNKKRRAAASNMAGSSASLFTTLESLSNVAPIKYHSITVIFILMGLFTLNCVQESVLLLYYFCSEQLYWLVYSLVALFTGQIITLILTLLSEIDLVNMAAAANNEYRSSQRDRSKCRNKDGTVTGNTSVSSTGSSPRQQLLSKGGDADAAAAELIMTNGGRSLAHSDGGSSHCCSNNAASMTEQEQDRLLTTYNTELYKIFRVRLSFVYFFTLHTEIGFNEKSLNSKINFWEIF
jgi:hypothetical protein